MSECREYGRISRRGFLKNVGSGLGAVALADSFLLNVASTFGQTDSGTGNLLVLCELNGGMDALSFLAPFKNSVYRSRRPQLALTANDVTPLPDNSTYGITNHLPFFSRLYAQGQLAVVQQVGYPDANGSHFQSQEIYEFGVRNFGASLGRAVPWYERLRTTYFDEPFGVMDTRKVGDPTRYGYPDKTYRNAAQDAFGRLARMERDRTDADTAVAAMYDKITLVGEDLRTRTEGFESTGEARGEFHRAAAIASAKLGTRILKVEYGGFDTHGSQDVAVEKLLPKINTEFEQFVNDLKALGLWERTCICFYTEFGRRNAENGSPGTDHGHGGHMILAGPKVNGGLHGQNVTSSDLNEDSLPYYVDFRAVFSDCIKDWLGFNPAPIFQIGGESFDTKIGSSLFV
jgi:uncharacterized protein (DUF1501 family)